MDYTKEQDAEFIRLSGLAYDTGPLGPLERFLLVILAARVAMGQRQPAMSPHELAKASAATETEVLSTLRQLEERGCLRVVCRTMHGNPAAYEIDEAALVRLRRPGA